MPRLERRMWLFTAVLGLVAGGRLARDSVVVGVAVAAAMLVVAWRTAPSYGGRTLRHQDLDSLPAEHQRVVVYWRPGCRYCSRLRRAVGPHRAGVAWVNIWQDDSAAAYVRSVNGGDEIVPTVVLDGEVMTNPGPEPVLRRLRQ